MKKSTKKSPTPKKEAYYIKSLEELQIDMDRIIGFVERYFTKTSIMLGVWGVVISIFFEENVSNAVVNTFSQAIHNVNFLSVCFIVVCTISILLFITGIIFFCITLVARAKNSHKDSKMFYTDIASNKNVDEYKNKIEQLTETDIREDYINQIYINSKLCKKKNSSYNKGVFLTLIGFGIFIVTLVIRLIFLNI